MEIIGDFKSKAGGVLTFGLTLTAGCLKINAYSLPIALYQNDY